MTKKVSDTVKNVWVEFQPHTRQFIATRDRFDMEQDIMQAWSTADNLKNLMQMYFDSRDHMTPDELWGKLDAVQQMHDLHMKRLWDTYLQAFELDGYYDPDKQTEPVPRNTKPKPKAKPKKTKATS